MFDETDRDPATRGTRRMRAREKLTSEEKVALALDLLKRARPLQEICEYYQVSHTTAYNIRNAFLEGGRRALSGEERGTNDRLRQLEAVVAEHTQLLGEQNRKRNGDGNGHDLDEAE
jgi:hypothetical protein